MKKLSAIIIAVAVVLGLGQCKKQEIPTTPDDNNNDTVYITVNVDNGGGKHYIEPNVGAYLFTDGDVLYVSNNGAFRGTLTYNNGEFDGYIVGASSSDYLYFYFLGGKEPAEAPVAGTTTSFTVSIADQSDNLPVLACARSTYKFDPIYASYKAVLQNKCGLVKILPKEPTTAALTVGNMHNVAKIDFNPQNGDDWHRIEPTSATGGITLFSEDENTKWAILLEQNEVINAPVTGEGYSNVTINIPKIDINMFSTEGIQMRYKVASGQNSSMYWDYFSDGTLQLRGDGTVAGYAFDDSWQYITQVKRIECPYDNNNIDFFNEYAFVCTNNSQLTDIVINTRSSLRIAHNAFVFDNGGLPVNITINNYVVDGFGPDPFDSNGAPLSIYFGSTYAANVTITNNAFINLTSQDFVSIPYGCIGVVPSTYEFYEEDDYLDCLEEYINKGNTAEEFIADNDYHEGDEYEVVTQGHTNNPINGGNASEIFGGAQVEIRY